MEWRRTAERARWRIWQLVTLGAVAATLCWAVLRWDLLGSTESIAACPVTSSFDELLPPDCWLGRGVLGIVADSSGRFGAIRVALVVSGVLLAIALIVAGSAARRQRSLVLCGAGVAIGLWVSVWAFEANAVRGDGVWWATRVVAWSPASVLTAGVLTAWLQSPWRTLSEPGLRWRRQHARGVRWVRARRAPWSVEDVQRWPDISQTPTPLVLRWPVTQAAEHGSAGGLVVAVPGRSPFSVGTIQPES